MPQPQRPPRRHLQTFARLRTAAPGDLADLEALERHAEPSDRLEWATFIDARDSTVMVACEGESLVGAIAVLHIGNAATARIGWIGVCPSARGRGVGTLLLDAAISAARDGGAAVLLADAPADAAALSHLLAASGFEPRSSAGTAGRYKRLLWSRRKTDGIIRLSFA